MRTLALTMLAALVLAGCENTTQPDGANSSHPMFSHGPPDNPGPPDIPGPPDDPGPPDGVGQPGLLLATTNQGNLVEIDLVAGTARLIGDAGVFNGKELGWTGISFDPDGNLFVGSRQRSEFITDNCPDFGSGGCTHLYIIDPGTGAVLLEVGSTLNTFISDIDFGDDGTLYGNLFLNLADEPRGGGRLVTIDPTTALATTIGRFGAHPFPRPFINDRIQNGGLSVHPQTGELWAVESIFGPFICDPTGNQPACQATIFKVDPVTGVANSITRLGLGGVPAPHGFGLDALEILRDGRFFGTRGGPGAEGRELYAIDPTPDPVSGLAELTLIPLSFGPGIQGSLNGLEASRR